MKDSSVSSSFTGTTRRPVIDPGALLQGRYRVIRRLGKGGMGAVYEATDLRLDVSVAIKEAFSTDPRLKNSLSMRLACSRSFIMQRYRGSRTISPKTTASSS